MTSTLAQDLGGVVRLLEDMTPGDLIVYDANEGDGWPPRPLWCFKNEAYDSGEEPALQGGIHYGGKEDADAIAAAVNFLRTHSAEIAGALRDAERLDALERLLESTNDGMILLHNGNGAGRGITGLGLQNTGRSLRQAIDDSAMQQGGGGGEAAA